jgi:aldehyde:ferredoxin oxidoreductase
LNSLFGISKKLCLCYDIGYNNRPLANFCHVVYATLGFRVASIGEAGEKGVVFAAIISEYRALGRGGAGAVMGSKKLKAIAVRGTQSIAIHAPDHFMTTCREAFNELANSPDTGGGRQKYGTNLILSLMDETGIHPVRNFQKGKFAGASQVNEEVIEKYYVRNKACFGCPIYCSKMNPLFRPSILSANAKDPVSCGAKG